MASILGTLGSIGSGIVNALTSSPLGSAASAVLSGLGSFFGQSDNENYQRELMREQMNFQSSENEKARDWQAEQWQKQFDLTNAYNTPEAQAERLRQAGINPLVAFEGTQSSSGSAPAIATPSTSHTASPVPDYSGVLTSGYNNLRSLTDTLKTLSDTRGQHIENSRLGNKIDTEIEETLARIDNEKAKTEYQKLVTQLETVFGAAMRSKELQKLQSELYRNIADSQLAISQGKYYDASALTQSYEQLLKYCQAHKLDKESEMIELQMQWYVPQVQSEIARNRGQAAAGFGSAEESHEQAEDIRQTRADRLRILAATAELDEVQANVAVETKREKIDALLQEYRRAKVLTDEEYEKYRQELYKANTQKVDKIMERIKSSNDILKGGQDIMYRPWSETLKVGKMFGSFFE